MGDKGTGENDNTRDASGDDNRSDATDGSSDTELELGFALDTDENGIADFAPALDGADDGHEVILCWGIAVDRLASAGWTAYLPEPAALLFKTFVSEHRPVPDDFDVDLAKGWWVGSSPVLWGGDQNPGPLTRTLDALGHPPAATVAALTSAMCTLGLLPRGTTSVGSSTGRADLPSPVDVLGLAPDEAAALDAHLAVTTDIVVAQQMQNQMYLASLPESKYVHFDRPAYSYGMAVTVERIAEEEGMSPTLTRRALAAGQANGLFDVVPLEPPDGEAGAFKLVLLRPPEDEDNIEDHMWTVDEDGWTISEQPDDSTPPLGP